MEKVASKEIQNIKLSTKIEQGSKQKKLAECVNNRKFI
jgi:hypothetical protein